jgi:hypothetical protein
MYGAYARPRCPSCRTASGPDCADASRGKGGQRKHEERLWRRDVEDDILDVEQELALASFFETTWMPDWYYDEAIDQANPIWVRL